MAAEKYGLSNYGIRETQEPPVPQCFLTDFCHIVLSLSVFEIHVPRIDAIPQTQDAKGSTRCRPACCGNAKWRQTSTAAMGEAVVGRVRCMGLGTPDRDSSRRLKEQRAGQLWRVLYRENITCGHAAPETVSARLSRFGDGFRAEGTAYSCLR